MTLHVHIQRLVVDGLSLRPHDDHALGEAVQRELSVLLEDRGAGAWPRTATTVSRLDGGTLPAAGARSVPALGAGIAGAVDAGIRQVSAR